VPIIKEQYTRRLVRNGKFGRWNNAFVRILRFYKNRHVFLYFQRFCRQRRIHKKHIWHIDKIWKTIV
jgi:hypothetical protein